MFQGILFVHLKFLNIVCEIWVVRAILIALIYCLFRGTEGQRVRCQKEEVTVSISSVISALLHLHGDLSSCNAIWKFLVLI